MPSYGGALHGGGIGIGIGVGERRRRRRRRWGWRWRRDVGVDGAAFQGLELGAALVGAALRTMGVTDAATGKCTNEALADFISAWAGVTRASAIVSVCLAEDRDDNATRKDLP